jgi:hypothetical protein
MHTRQCSALRRVVSSKAFSSSEQLQVRDKRSTCKRARTSSWYSEDAPLLLFKASTRSLARRQMLIMSPTDLKPIGIFAKRKRSGKDDILSMVRLCYTDSGSLLGVREQCSL